MKYLIRLDDACPYMDAKNWQRMEDILDQYGVKPLVGIIPANADPQTMIEPEDIGFWEKAHRWEEKGWEIALHGFDHVCVSDRGMNGLNPFWERSEFAGLSLEQQKYKIRKGLAVLNEHGFETKYFFPPSHTFDENTLEALRSESDIRIVSDTVAMKPYRTSDFTFIPQILGHCSKMLLPGIYTFCFHPNTMSGTAFVALENFLSQYKSLFIRFCDLDLTTYGRKALSDKFLSWIFFTYRRVRRLK